MKADISIPTIEKKFAEFNTRYFNGQLKKPNFAVTNSARQLGCCKVSSKKVKGETISISAYYEVETSEMENTIIHEMIHLYQYQVLKEGMNHKASFKRLSEQIAKASNNKYIITRTNSRTNYKLSAEGQLKAERSARNAKTPIILVVKETNNSGEFAWFVRVTDKYYDRIFYKREVERYYPNVKVLGFIYGKPKTWMYTTATSRHSLRGKRIPWDEFVTNHKKDIMRELTLKSKDSPTKVY